MSVNEYLTVFVLYWVIADTTRELMPEKAAWIQYANAIVATLIFAAVAHLLGSN
ncbi:unnamed protein product [marine sediment metagenome]|uniref:Uncharacterized protein n=1 Tax=marine sediment metagenome TaxID=412755 RepID=X0YVE8_9ZZZZ